MTRERPALAVVGKGGAGKSVISGTLARLLARRGHRVLALDSDTLPGMELSLGARAPAEPPLLHAAQRGENGRWRYKPGDRAGAPRAALLHRRRTASGSCRRAS